MKKIIKVCLLISTCFAIVLISCSKAKPQRDPITITTYASEAELSFDDLIKLADLIVIGQFISVQPSRWDTPNGKLPDNATLEMVSENKWSIFTDHDFMVNKYIKGNTEASIISIRVFDGQVEDDKMIASDQPDYETGKDYLLFLFVDNGPTSSVSPGAYYGTSSPFQILDNKAKSNKDEWVIEELIAYIQKSLSAKSLIETPISTDLPTEMPSATATP